MRHLSNLLKGINKLTEILTIFIIVVLVIVVAAQVFFRYVLSDSLSWSEELARYLFIWVTFLGAEITLRYKEHIGLDFLINNLKGIYKLILSLFIDLIIIGFATIVLISGIELTQSTLNQYSSALGIPVGLVYLAIPVSMTLMIINVIHSMVNKVIKRSTDIKIINSEDPSFD